jgi:hypothetical protein
MRLAMSLTRPILTLRPLDIPSQGGFLSIAEAAYHGVPIVGLPLIAGQGELIRFAADQVGGARGLRSRQ